MSQIKHLTLISLLAVSLFSACQSKQKQLTDYVNPFLGTATLWETAD